MDAHGLPRPASVGATEAQRVHGRLRAEGVVWLGVRGRVRVRVRVLEGRRLVKVRGRVRVRVGVRVRVRVRARARVRIRVYEDHGTGKGVRLSLELQGKGQYVLVILPLTQGLVVSRGMLQEELQAIAGGGGRDAERTLQAERDRSRWAETRQRLRSRSA